MKQMIALQMSIFGSFESIDANPVLVSELIPLYDNKFIPSIMQMAEIDPVNNTIKSANRLSMISVDSKITIAFLPDRIDCNYTFGDEENDPGLIESKLQDMCQLLMCTVSHLSVIGNRIAINGRFVTDEVSLEYKDYILGRDFYREVAPCEWSTNSNATTMLNILNANESANNILTVSLGKNIHGDTALIVTFDINTVPGNSIMRFREDSLSIFLEQASTNLKKMLLGLR